MKKIAVGLIAFSLFVAGCSKDNMTDATSNQDDLYSEAAFISDDTEVNSVLPDVNNPAVGTLTPDEEAGLIFMREEEKVARDVYIKMAEKWNVRIFHNIKRSEQVHMNAIRFLLTRYNVPDPVGNNAVGVFTSPELQALYDALIIRGNASLNEALKVGRDIEIEDIADIDHQLQNVVVNTELVRVYTRLKRASGFHLAAFNYWLQQAPR